jgi:hypothetical protein
VATEATPLECACLLPGRQLDQDAIEATAAERAVREGRSDNQTA